MIIASNNIIDMLNSPVRKIQAKVELYEGSTLVDTYSYTDRLISFSVERVGDESKFFGYTICQKVNIHLIDKARELNITTANSFKVYFGVNDEYICPFPTFFVTQCRRDENTNELSITAYDLLYGASKHTVAEMGLPQSYMILQFVGYASNVIGTTGIAVKDIGTEPFMTEYPEGANYDGTETVRDALDDAAEATQTICFVNSDDNLVFRGLDKNKAADFIIDKSKYITLDSGTNRRIQTVMHVTELGDNVSASTEHTGSTAYIRENPFWDLRDDIGTLVDNALAIVGDLTINQFECEWRGNFLLELGDKIGLITKDNETVYSYLLDETIEYNGTLSAQTRWEYTNSDSETESNPSSLGEALKQTYARVDKANKEITLLANETNTKIETTKTELEEYTNTSIETKAAEIKVTTDAITQSVNETNELIGSTKTELESTINQTASSIRSEITAQGEVITSIQQDLDGISLTYNSTNGTASITIGDTTVSNLVDGEYVDDVVAGIDLTGYVRISDLEESGSTVINGDNITTGTIDAEYLNLTRSITWGDLTTSCKNEIEDVAASYATDVPDYIHSTYIDETDIYSPNIYGAKITAGTSSDGYMQMSSTGMNFVSEGGGSLLGIGYLDTDYNFPYIVFGAGVDTSGTDKGLIKKYSNGIWIGDSDAIGDSSPSGVGLFIDFTTGSVYFYPGDGTRKTLASPG